jgi:hypothetical protein
MVQKTVPLIDKHSRKINKKRLTNEDVADNLI